MIAQFLRFPPLKNPALGSLFEERRDFLGFHGPSCAASLYQTYIHNLKQTHKKIPMNSSPVNWDQQIWIAASTQVKPFSILGDSNDLR